MRCSKSAPIAIAGASRPLSDAVLTVDQMRAAEQAAMDAGTGEWELMQRAGEGAAQWIARMAAGRAVTVLCGPGNNGGDGYVIAESLARRGNAVQVVAPVEPGSETSSKARRHCTAQVATEADRFEPVVVDCLFGYGLSRTVEGEFSKLLEKLKESDCFKIAIDVPSVVASDSGEVLGPLAEYDLTLALGAWKRAHFLMPAMAAMGARRLVPIGLDLPRDAACLAARPKFSAPPSDSHKYSRGLLAIVAGAMPGAPLMAAEAAMRAGAGYVKLLSEHSHPDAPAELVLEEGQLAKALDDDRIDALLVGPGLGRDNTARDRLGEVLATGNACVLDADALHLLDRDLLGGKHASRIVATPHEGELAKLCETFGVTAQGKMDRARALSESTGLIILAKGPDTILAGNGNVRFFRQGSTWLSTAGTGDVLAGIVASRLAHHGEPLRAAEEGVWLQHEAARICGPAFTAGDLAKAVDRAVATFL